MEQSYVAFDLGAESGRAILGTLAGDRLSLDVRHRFPNPTARLGGHLHWNALSQWEELKAGLRKCATSTRLAGLGVDTWGVDFGLISTDGDLLGAPVHYRDGRTDGMMEKAFAIVPRERLFDATGIQFMQLNTLFQLLALKEQSPHLLEQAESLLFMPDLFHFFFTGERRCEFSIASTSQMLDPRTRSWAIDILQALGLPTRILLPVVPSGTVIGSLLPDVAEECGVAPAPVIAGAGHDTAAAVAAVPATGDDWCYISSGTWSLMGVELDQPLINAKSLEYNYTNEGGVGGKIRFLKNIMGMWLVQECRRHFAAQGNEHSYAELVQMALECAPGGALIDPDHAPFLTPGNMPGKIEDFCRKTAQRPPATRGEFVRTCLESLALTYRRTLEGLEDVLGRTLKVIHIVGGGSQNELLNQMTADACGRPVIAGPIEATAAGNILVQAMAAGQIRSLSDARAVIRNSFDVKHYTPSPTPAWHSAYTRFRSLQPR